MPGPDRHWNGTKWIYPGEGAEKVRRALDMARMAVDHIDGDPTNNDPDNLRFVPLAENRRGE